MNKSAEMTPFFADNSFHFCMGIKLPEAYKRSVDQKTKMLNADRIVANQKKMGQVT